MYIARKPEPKDGDNSKLIKIKSNFQIEPDRFIGSSEPKNLEEIVIEGEGFPLIHEDTKYDVIFSISYGFYAELEIILDSLARPDLVEEIVGSPTEFKYKTDFINLEGLINAGIPMKISLVKTTSKTFNLTGYESWKHDEA